MKDFYSVDILSYVCTLWNSQLIPKLYIQRNLNKNFTFPFSLFLHTTIVDAINLQNMLICSDSVQPPRNMNFPEIFMVIHSYQNLFHNYLNFTNRTYFTSILTSLPETYFKGPFGSLQVATCTSTNEVALEVAANCIIVF